MMKDEYKQNLNKNQYNICCKKGTEPPFKNKYWNHKEQGIYQCVCCSKDLFSSNDKFDSKTGWPSFTRPINKNALSEIEDKSLNQVRTEVICQNCGSHLGHVFNDGPPPTHLRYCINSTSLNFKKIN